MRTWHYIIKYAAIALAVLVVIAVFAGIVRLISYLIPGFSSNATGKWETYEIKNEISVLDVDIHQIDLELLTSSDSELRVESNYKYLAVTEEGDKLLVKDKRNFFFNLRGNAVLRIYVPEGKVFDKVDIRTGAGMSEFEGLRARAIDMDFGAGKSTLKNVFVSEQARIDTGAGKISIRDSEFNNLELDLGVGNFEFSGLLMGKNDLRMGVGTSTIDLAGSLDDYKIQIEKGIGEIRVGGDNVKDDIQIGLGERELYCEGGVGSIEINFSE